MPSRAPGALSFVGALARTLAGVFPVFCLLAVGELASHAQSRAPATKATVKIQSLTVYSRMSTSSPVVKLLKEGHEVTVDFEMQGMGEAWCTVREPGQHMRLGYALCRYLERAPIPVATGPWAGTVEVLRGPGSTFNPTPKEPRPNQEESRDAASLAFAPGFMLRDIDGRAVSLASLRGRVVVLEFWTTWCPACRVQMPYLERLHREFAARGLTIVGVNLAEAPDRVRQFLRENNYTFTALLDPELEAARLYRAESLPTTVFIDAQGKIVAIHYGWRGEQDLRAALKRAGLS